VGLAKYDSPVFGLTQVLGHRFEHAEVGVMGTSGELAEGYSGIANVRATSDICVEQFTKQSPVGKTMFGGDVSMFRGAFRVASILVQSSDSISVERGGMSTSVFTVGSRPTMGAENSVDVVVTGEDNAIIVLLDVKSIEVREEAQVFERWRSLGGELKALANEGINALSKGFIGASKGKVIHLAKQQNMFSINDSRVDGAIMGGALKSKLRGLQNGVDVGFPKATRFRMSL